jgi:hypothetical protein
VVGVLGKIKALSLVLPVVLVGVVLLTEMLKLLVGPVYLDRDMMVVVATQCMELRMNPLVGVVVQQQLVWMVLEVRVVLVAGVLLPL